MSDEGETAKLHTRVGNLRNDLNAHLVECARATAELLAAIEKNTEASERLGAQIDALSLEMDNRFARNEVRHGQTPRRQVASRDEYNSRDNCCCGGPHSPHSHYGIRNMNMNKSLTIIAALAVAMATGVSAQDSCPPVDLCSDSSENLIGIRRGTICALACFLGGTMFWSALGFP